MRKIILIICCILLGSKLFAQFNNGPLKKFNVQLNIGLLNYQIKAEYSPAHKHLIGLGVGYGFAYLNDFRPFVYSFQKSDYIKEWWLTFDAYHSYLITLNYKYYILKNSSSEVIANNQGFYFLSKIRFLGSENKNITNDDHRIKSVLKVGAGIGLNIKFNPSGAVGMDMQYGIGLNINSQLNYSEFMPITKLGLYIMFNK